MMKKLKYLCAGMLALAVVAFVACDDDDEGLNGWTDTAYVYVQGETLGNDMLKQAVVRRGWKMPHLASILSGRA